MGFGSFDSSERSFAEEKEGLDCEEKALVKKALLGAAGQGAILIAPDPLSFSISLTDAPPIVMGSMGVAAPYMLSGNPSVELGDPFVILLNAVLDRIEDIVPFLEEAMKWSSNVFVVAPDIAREVHATFLLNRLRGTLNVVTVESPRYNPFYNEVALLTGATVLDVSKGVSLEMAGRANRVIADRTSTVIIGNESGKSPHLVPLIRIGSASEAELDSKKKAITELVAKSGGDIKIVELQECPA